MLFNYLVYSYIKSGKLEVSIGIQSSPFLYLSGEFLIPFDPITIMHSLLFRGYFSQIEWIPAKPCKTFITNLPQIFCFLVSTSWAKWCAQSYIYMMILNVKFMDCNVIPLSQTQVHLVHAGAADRQGWELQLHEETPGDGQTDEGCTVCWRQKQEQGKVCFTVWPA